MNNMPFIFYLIFSGFTMNLVLQCGLGINSESKNINWKSTLIKYGIIFFTVISLWIVLTGIASLINSRIFIFVLSFPVSYMAYEGLEHFIFRYINKESDNLQEEEADGINFPGGIAAAALFICLISANSILKAVSLAFGFSAGALFVYLILSEIQKRAALEAVPHFLRGKPLILISMGLLSLVFTKVSLLLFRVIGS
jgi:electron transport complex protein RnfA